MRICASMWKTLLIVNSFAIIAVSQESAAAGEAASMAEVEQKTQGGDYQGAIALLSELLEDDPDNLEMLEARAKLYLATGAYDRAFDDANRLTALKPGNASYVYNRGCAQLALGRHKEAVEDFTKSIELDETWTEAYTNRGVAYARWGKLQLAIDDFTTAIGRNGLDRLAFHNRALARRRLGQVDKAQADWEQAKFLRNMSAVAVARRPSAAPAFASSESLALRAERRRRALALGATKETERAVDLGLDWLIRHQQTGGSWSFDHQQAPRQCEGCPCSHSGNKKSRQAVNGATALALLPLLGAGNTHRKGPYRRQTELGLRFLLNQQKADGSWHESGGTMYSHGLATLAVCEALIMTQDDAPQVISGAVNEAELARAAQSGIRFIERAQHEQGGWRYQPKQPGDTSVLGWQLMALQAGFAAGLDVNPHTIAKAKTFLNHVSNDAVGSSYGYEQGAQREDLPLAPVERATTPVGLLCRMYTGWPRDNPGLALGVERIALTRQPGKGMYFYYYATSVMHHYGGPKWREWDDWMSGHLLDAQSETGSEAGSWQLNGKHDDAGRLYCTAMALLTLQVYYRYAPLYAH